MTHPNGVHEMNHITGPLTSEQLLAMQSQVNPVFRTSVRGYNGYGPYTAPDSNISDQLQQLVAVLGVLTSMFLVSSAMFIGARRLVRIVLR